MQYGLILWYLQVANSTKLLNDSLLDEDGWQEAAEWVSNECFKQLASSGLQVVAWVLPRHLAAFHDTSRVLASLQQLLVDNFTDAQAAYDWLLNQPPTARGSAAAELPSSLLTVAAFLALSYNEQLRCIEQVGRAQVSRWEADYYVQPYYLPPNLLVEFYQYAHSGVLYQVRARTRQASE